MKKPGTAMTILLTLLLWNTQAYALFGGKVASYTADQVYTNAKGDEIQSSRIYVTPDKIRMDGIAGPGNGKALGIIYHIDEKRQCLFNQEKKLYYEGPLDEDKMKQDLKSIVDLSQESKELGTEKVSGFKCTKREVVSTVKIFGMTQKSKSTVWVSDRFDMPLKTLSEDGSMMIMKNIDQGSPSSSVFKNPEGYEKVSSIIAVMGIDFSRGDRDSDDDIDDEESTGEENIDEENTVPEKISSEIKDKFNKVKGFFKRKKETSDN